MECTAGTCATLAKGEGGGRQKKTFFEGLLKNVLSNMDQGGWGHGS